MPDFIVMPATSPCIAVCGALHFDVPPPLDATNAAECLGGPSSSSPPPIEITVRDGTGAVIETCETRIAVSLRQVATPP